MQGTDSLDSIESPLSSVEDDAATPAALSGTGSSSSRRSAGGSVITHRSNITNTRSPAGADDADWLTAVLSVSTSKLSVHSNAVLTNSLKRLASLRLTGGSSAAAAAAAAVEGPEGLVGLLESVRARFASFGLQHFEEVALQLGQLGYQPDDEWLASFERWAALFMHFYLFSFLLIHYWCQRWCSILRRWLCSWGSWGISLTMSGWRHLKGGLLWVLALHLVVLYEQTRSTV
jgi:hypothetical protein